MQCQKIIRINAVLQINEKEYYTSLIKYRYFFF